jgi:hypothetical protein
LLLFLLDIVFYLQSYSYTIIVIEKPIHRYLKIKEIS